MEKKPWSILGQSLGISTLAVAGIATKTQAITGNTLQINFNITLSFG
jgi:hypothetical protein